MAANPTTENLRNAAHLGAISGGQEVEKKAELEADSKTPREVTRREDEGTRSSRSSWRQWRWRLCRRRREREAERVGGRWVSAGVAWRP